MQKTSRFSRLMAVLLAVFMAVCCLPLSAFAEGELTKLKVTFQDTNGHSQAYTLDELKNSIVVPDAATIGATVEGNYCWTTDTWPSKATLKAGDTISLSDFIGYDVEYITYNLKVEETVEPEVSPLYVTFQDAEGHFQQYVFDANKDTITVPDAAAIGATVEGNYCWTTDTWPSKATLKAGDTITRADYAGYDVDYITYNLKVEETAEPEVSPLYVTFQDVEGHSAQYVFDANKDTIIVPDAATIGATVGGNYCWTTDTWQAKATLNAGDTITRADYAGYDVDYITYNLKVEEPVAPTDVIMNVVFMADGQSVGGGDYFLPEGVQNYTILNQYVPAGYKIAESGDFMVTANGKLEVRVEKISTDVIMNIVFKTADGTVAGGGDYFLPEGVQKLSILDKYVPAGYKICETGDFMVTDGGSREVRVEKISNTVIMNIVFKTAEGYVAGGGDYFLPEGVQNYKILNQYVPEGYRLCVTGDFMVTDGGHETVRVEKIPDDVIVKTAVFRKGADDIWNENEDNPDEVRYSFFSDDPEATNTVPSITTGDKTKVLDYWVSERDDSVTLKPGAEFCFNDLKKGDLGNEAGDFAFYPVYKDAPKTPADGGNTSSGSSNNNSSNSNTTTVTATNDNGETVVKAAAAPANNSAKILPQTGVAEQTPVAFGVMMFAALAGAAAYLFAIRKKLN